MFKKVLLIAAFAVVPAAHACSFRFVAPDNLTAVIKENGGSFDLSDEKCRLMSAAGVKFSLQGQATVLGGVSVGWVSAGVAADNGLVSTYYSNNTALNAKELGSMDRANQLMYAALNNAVDKLDVAAAIAELRENRRRSK